MRELGNASLTDALDYLELLAIERPDKFDRAAVRWHRRLEVEVQTISLVESQFALSALGSLRAGDPRGFEDSARASSASSPDVEPTGPVRDGE